MLIEPDLSYRMAVNNVAEGISSGKADPSDVVRESPDYLRVSSGDAIDGGGKRLWHAKPEHRHYERTNGWSSS